MTHMEECSCLTYTVLTNPSKIVYTIRYFDKQRTSKSDTAKSGVWSGPKALMLDKGTLKKKYSTLLHLKLTLKMDLSKIYDEGSTGR